MLPSPITIPCAAAKTDELLTKEWLLSNKLGSYASSTPLGCNTRRYHGLLVAATSPPAGRVVALNSIMEQIVFPDGESVSLATIEFPGAISPNAQPLLAEYRDDVAPTFVYRVRGLELTKEIMIAEQSNAVAVRYTLRSGGGAPAKGIKLALWPFTGLRDYHSLRKVHEPHQITFEIVQGGVSIQDRMRAGSILYVVSQEAQFLPRPQWWYRFLYREDIARGQDGYEDLYTPGSFTCDLVDGQPCQITASLDEPHPLGFATTLDRRRTRLEELVAGVDGEMAKSASKSAPRQAAADDACRRLAVATEAFNVLRSFPNSPPSPTIVAGYPWFIDWGRDTFISLPGLLLSTGRFEQARGVFKTFASYMSQGMIPNVFDDYSPAAHYNSLDASLWFVLAGWRYLQASGDKGFWRNVIMPACNAILTAYHDGTMFDIHADADGLLMGGSHKTQLTWMDAKLGDDVITPRHGKAVETNALWHCAHRIMAQEAREFDSKLADRCQERAEMIAAAFAKAFWNPSARCLYDCITDGVGDATIRPNQIFAVSLPHSPLTLDQQSAVVGIVREHLLTPCGLRSLSPFDGRYRRRYGGSWESRDRSYHQGTVWGWLIGPFIEAYLKVEHGKPHAVEQARQWLSHFDDHLREAGLGSVSEIFDGDAPHTPRGCIAQAWSVAEVLRAKMLVARYEKEGK